jgi:hypothetical protein
MDRLADVAARSASENQPAAGWRRATRPPRRRGPRPSKYRRRSRSHREPSITHSQSLQGMAAPSLRRELSPPPRPHHMSCTQTSPAGHPPQRPRPHRAARRVAHHSVWSLIGAAGGACCQGFGDPAGDWPDPSARYRQRRCSALHDRSHTPPRAARLRAPPLGQAHRSRSTARGRANNCCWRCASAASPPT